MTNTIIHDILLAGCLKAKHSLLNANYLYMKVIKILQIIIVFIAMSLLVSKPVLAWDVLHSVKSICVSENEAGVKVTFQNTQPAWTNMSMDVTAVDLQSGKSLYLGTLTPGQKVEGTFASGKNQISKGTVIFKLTWTSGRSGYDERKGYYHEITCPQPTPTLIPTATPRPTVTPTPAVTGTVVPTSTPTPTPAATSTPTPTSTPRPTATPTPTPTPQGQVQGTTTPQLPATGAESKVILSLLSLLPAGIIMRNKSRKIFGNKKNTLK